MLGWDLIVIPVPGLSYKSTTAFYINRNNLDCMYKLTQWKLKNCETSTLTFVILMTGFVMKTDNSVHAHYFFKWAPLFCSREDELSKSFVCLISYIMYTCTNLLITQPAREPRGLFRKYSITHFNQTPIIRNSRFNIKKGNLIPSLEIFTICDPKLSEHVNDTMYKALSSFE